MKWNRYEYGDSSKNETDYYEKASQTRRYYFEQVIKQEKKEQKFLSKTVEEHLTYNINKDNTNKNTTNLKNITRHQKIGTDFEDTNEK